MSTNVSSVGVLRIYQSSIGKKVIMAITGLIWIGFVAGHVYGNLKVFSFFGGGAEYFNEYAEGLRMLGEPVLGPRHFLIVFRLILILAIVAHVWAALTLRRQSWSARSDGYAQHRTLSTNVASKYIFWGGVAILFFIIFHLAHFTWYPPFSVNPDYIPGDAYHNLVSGFQMWGGAVTIIYFIALAALALHLYHGTWSMFQTLGLNNQTYTKFIRGLAWIMAIFIPLGFALVPLSVLFGIIS